MSAWGLLPQAPWPVWVGLIIGTGVIPGGLALSLGLAAAPALAALAPLTSAAPLGQSRHRPDHYQRQGESHR